jgi:type 1 fimbria pilin
MMKRVNAGLMILLVQMVCFPAETAPLEIDILLGGNLVAPPQCTINNSELIDVDFGSQLGVNKINGVNYRIPVNYQIDCEDVGNGDYELSLSLTGETADFDNDALKTDRDSLGIRLYLDNKVFTPGANILISKENPPTLEAVPVKQDGVTLDEGEFVAWATLRAQYQ